MTTMKQPFQCNLQPEIQEPHRTTHTDTTTRCKTHRRNNSRTKRPQPHPSHRRGTFHRRLQPLYTEKTHGFVLRLPPQNITHATFMQPLQCNLQPQLQEPHRTTHTDTTTRCKTHRRNNSRTKRPQPHPSHRRGTFHRRLQPLYTEKHKVWCSGFLPNIAHATFMQPLQCVSQHPVANPHLSTHVATSNDDNEAAIPMQSATRDSRTA